MPWLKTRCVRYLNTVPVTIPLTVMAKKFALSGLYTRCIRFYGEQFNEMDKGLWINVVQDLCQRKEPAEKEIINDILERVHQTTTDIKKKSARTHKVLINAKRKIDEVANEVSSNTPANKRDANKSAVLGLKLFMPQND